MRNIPFLRLIVLAVVLAGSTLAYGDDHPYGLTDPDAIAIVARFQAAKQKAQAERDQAVTEARDKLVADLTTLRTQLVQAGDTDGAAKIRTAIAQIKNDRQILGTPGGANTQTARSGSNGGAPSKPGADMFSGKANKPQDNAEDKALQYNAPAHPGSQVTFGPFIKQLLGPYEHSLFSLTLTDEEKDKINPLWDVTKQKLADALQNGGVDEFGFYGGGGEVSQVLGDVEDYLHHILTDAQWTEFERQLDRSRPQEFIEGGGGMVPAGGGGHGR